MHASVSDIEVVDPEGARLAATRAERGCEPAVEIPEIALLGSGDQDLRDLVGRRDSPRRGLEWSELLEVTRIRWDPPVEVEPSTHGGLEREVEDRESLAGVLGRELDVEEVLEDQGVVQQFAYVVVRDERDVLADAPVEVLDRRGGESGLPFRWRKPRSGLPGGPLNQMSMSSPTLRRPVIVACLRRRSLSSLARSSSRYAMASASESKAALMNNPSTRFSTRHLAPCRIAASRLPAARPRLRRTTRLNGLASFSVVTHHFAPSDGTQTGPFGTDGYKKRGRGLGWRRDGEGLWKRCRRGHSVG